MTEKTDNSKVYPQGDTFGERLRSLRKAYGLSQNEFAEKLGYETETSISQIETGEVLPDTAALNRMIEVCPVDLHWMITGKAGLCVGLDIELLSFYFITLLLQTLN
jgi:transcriptional regulator with XRE-family HTH domain